MRLVLTGTIALALAGPAAAATVVTTFTGYIADVQGTYGSSSPFGEIIPGHGYTLAYTINDALPTAVTTTGAYGKKVTGAGTVTAAITINGITRTIGGSTTSTADNRTGEPNGGRLFDSVLRTSQDFSYTGGVSYSDSYAQTSVGSYLSHFLAGGDYLTPFTYVPSSGDSYTSTVHFNLFDYTTNTQLVNVYLSLGAGTASQTISGAVPEPASWAMMIAGFGVIGSAMRRRRVAKANFA